MIQRTTVPVDDQSSIAVVTEQMADGGWAVVGAGCVL
jgi:phenylpyruvate tautomerase PptA (4-oxalocrotonate tautomerase family)